MPEGHRFPSGQLPLQLLSESLGDAPNLPTGQACGAALPRVQKLPGGQGFCVAEVVAAGQKKPAGQAPLQELLVSPSTSPYLPARHEFCVALMEGAPHQWPRLHNPVHVATAIPLVLP